MRRSFTFHVPQSWLNAPQPRLLPFYETLIDGLKRAGHDIEIKPLYRDGLLNEVAQDERFHIVNHGQFEHPRVLNAGIAYIYPFWHMDPKGIRANASIAEQVFKADQIDAEIARPFFRRLRQRLVGKRTSRYPQPEATESYPVETTAVFLQSDGHRGLGETCYLSQSEMVQAVLDHTNGSVLVKPHPLDEDAEWAALLAAWSKTHPRLTISHGNIHDIIAAASKVVTVNSAVGIEAYLHRKPVILCGQADFHHIAQTARSVEDLGKMLNTPPRKRAYDKYVYWYFGLHCLSTADPELTSKFLARVTTHTQRS